MLNTYKTTKHYYDKNITAKINDITGIPAIGKTTWLHKHVRHKHIVLDRNAFPYDPCIKGGCFKCLTIDAFRLLLFIISRKELSYSSIFWLLKNSLTLRENVYIRLNVFRNCVLKFMRQRDAKHLSLRLSDTHIFIDEGISHIPFLLQNQPNCEKVINEFYEYFHDYLSILDVICLDGNINTQIRLKKRGHKRLISATDQEIEEFVDMNKKTLRLVKKKASIYANFITIDVGV